MDDTSLKSLSADDGGSPSIDIKQEADLKYEFDSGSQDSSLSGGGGGGSGSGAAAQRWAPNLNGIRKSAFTPYKLVQCTALTNLQRGNTQARVPELQTPDASFHSKAGRGELSREDIHAESHVDVTDAHFLTALHWAASYGQLLVCQNLVWCGADVNYCGPEGETALHLAAVGGHHEVAKFLLAEGADVNAQDDAGNTALMYSASGDYPYTCNELLLAGADLTITNEMDMDAFTITVNNDCRLAQAVIENFLLGCLLKM